MKRYSLISFLCFFLLVNAYQSGYAQKGKKKKPADYGIKSKKALSAFLKGKEQTKYRDYPRAIAFFDEAVAIEPGFGEAYMQMGGSYFALHQYEKAYHAFEKAKANLENPNAITYYYLGECALRQDKFAEAVAYYETFIKANPAVPQRIYDSAIKSKKQAEFGAKAVRSAIKFEPLNLGDEINTQFEEYLPYLTADGQTIFFTSRRPGCTGGFNREYRDYTEDFYFSELKDGKWQRAQNLGAPVNTALNEGAASFSPDGQYVFFTACHRKDGYGDCDIFVAKLDGDKWLSPQNLGPIVNSPSWESQPCISNDGRTLYFASNRAGGLGKQDIWYTTLEKGRWTAPQNMGAPINTKGSEVSPFLHADGRTLYFSSDFHPGFGGLDLFLSKNTGKGWTQPANLGYPLNTAASEGNIFVTTKGDKGYINSSRKGSLGKSDIYEFELDEKIRPDHTTYVRGMVREKGTKKVLAAKVIFINIETRDTIRSVRTNKATGQFLLTLPMEQDYAAFVDKKGYLFASEFFSLKNIDSKETPYYDVEIDLEPLKVGIEVVMSSVFYETDKFALLGASKAELEHLVYFMKVNRKVKVEIGGHTDNVGSSAYNRELSRNRAAEVRRYMMDRGIDKGRISANGYGETQPLADNETEAGRALNRRTVCRITGI
ncbi:MAG TPA: tetratricopeptide repeat protein [Bacteroidetes bacterium]|nr:tetratricopeptide repeat protein [Bacteroidota bacterium]